MTEKVRSLQPRLKVKYVGYGERDGDNGTIRHCKLSGGERHRHELADSFFHYKNLGHQINLSGAKQSQEVLLQTGDCRPAEHLPK